MRADIRRNRQPLDGYALAGHLDKYTETGDVYVKLIRNLIRRNDLTRGDTARLAPGPRILFVRFDQK
jgi:Bax protein